MKVQTRFFLALLTLTLLLFAMNQQASAHHSVLAAENSQPLGLWEKMKLLPQLGIRKTWTVIMTNPKNKGAEYHSFVYDITCESPNYWAVPETDDPVCSQVSSRFSGIKCGEVCPPERQTGAVCIEGHHCCRPAIPSLPPSPESGCQGKGNSIQYCDIKF